MTLSKKTKSELIAEVKKLQGKLALSEKSKVEKVSKRDVLWKPIFLHSANIVVVIDKNFNIIDINKSIKGLAKKEVIGKKAFEFATKESTSIIKKAVLSVFKTAKPEEYIVESVFPKGDLVTFECTASPVLENKKVVAVVVEAADITKQSGLKASLEKNEELFRMLAQNATDIVYRYNFYPTFECEFISPSVKKTTGYAQEEYYKDPTLGTRIIHPEDQHLSDKNTANIFSSKPNETVPPFICRSIRKDKKIVWLESINKPIFDNTGKIIAIEGITRDITERKKVEDTLKHSEENLAQVLNNINELVYYIEFLPEGKRHVKYVSNQIKKILDVTPEEYKNSGEKLIKFCHEDDIEKIKQVAKQLRKTKQPLEYTYRFYHRSKKEYIWIEERIVPQIDDKGKHIGNFGLVRDVTEHFNAENQLRISEEKFRMLAENAVDVVFRFSFFPTSRYEYVSPSIFQMSGYTPEEFYADPNLGFKIIHPDDKHILGDSEKLISEKLPINNVKEPLLTVRWIKRDGSIIWTETVNTPVRNKEGKVIAMEGISRDITQQKEGEERFRILANATFEGIVFSEQGRIIDANDQFLQMYGYSSVNEVNGKHIIDFVVENQRDTIFESLRLPKSEPVEIQTIKKDKSIIVVETKAQNIPYFGKTIRATVVYDITQRKQYEQSLRESERTLSTLMNNLPGMAYRCNFDEKWSMIFVSQGCLELTGYNGEDLIQNSKVSFIDLIFPDDRKKVKEQVREAIKNKTPYVLSYRILTASEKLKWVWEKGEGVFSDKGEFLFLEGFIVDATDRQKFESELKASRENYKSLVDYSPDGVIIHVDGKMKFANPSALEILGASSFDELIGHSAIEFILPEYHEQTIERIAKTKAGEKLDFVEVKIKNKKGEIKTLETKSILIKFDGEDAIQVVFHDTSTQKQLVKEQLRAQLAEETNEILEHEITKRKVIQLQLQESQKYTRLLINSSLDMICACDKEGYITEFNVAAQRTFGYTAEEAIGKHVSMLYGDSDQKNMITNEQLYKTGFYSGEVNNVRRNREVFVSFLSASLLRNEEGEIMGSMGVSRDISTLKKAEQELKDSEEKYRIIYNHVFVGIAKVSLKGEFMQVNEPLCKMLGYTEQELCSSTFVDVTDKEDIEKSKTFLNQLVSGEKKNISFEKRYKHKNNTLIYCNLKVSVVFTKDGSPDYFISVFENITERKNAEDKIKAQSAKLNAVFESSSHLIWTLGADLCLTSFNQNFFRFFKKHYNRDVYIGLNMTSDEMKTSDEYNDFWKNKYKEALNGERQHFETKLLEENVIWREVFLNPIFDANGIAQEISGIANDITEKKLAEEKIKQSLQEKEVLLKEVHHRVKNNLQVISSILNLQSSYVKDQGTLNILKESQNRIKSMAFIHESLYQTKDFSSINFSEYVINLSQNLIHSYSNFGNEIKLNLDIQNVFLNLDLAIPCGLIINEIVSNALKYAFVDKRGDCEVSVQMKLEDEDLILIVADNGIGLPKDFDYRNTQSLGLQLVVTLTDQLNGTIEMDRENGTRYTIIFKQYQVKNRI